MQANFPTARWDRIRAVYDKWWNRELDRPIINVTLTGADSKVEKPAEPMYQSLSQYNMTVPAETIVRHWQYMLLCNEYLGDSYPMFLPDYGAGVNAAFMGCRSTLLSDTVWFEPRHCVPAAQLRFTYDPDESIFRRIKDIYLAASRLFHGDVVMGMTHLNNGIDIVSRFFGSQKLALMLYDDPTNVIRLIWENHELMYQYLNELTRSMGPVPGYTCFGNIYADEPWIASQSDFSALIGPRQFEQFILPELMACFKRSKYNFYHLDGPGELPHLDILCDIPELKCIQWGPGAGASPEGKWPEVYRKISRSKKNIWVTGDIENIEIIAQQIGTTKGIYWCGQYSALQRDKVLKILEKFGAV